MTVPAHSIEAERCVLGAILLDPGVLDILVAEVTPTQFYLSKHRIVYEAALALHTKRAPIDKVSLIEQLRCTGLLEIAGGPVEVDGLTSVVPTSANAVYYAQIVADKARVRATQEAVRWASDVLDQRIENSTETLEAVEKRIFQATRERVRDESSTAIVDVLGEAFRAMEAAKNGVVQGVPSGLAELDELLVGGLPRELVILGGRPGSGKSTLALNIAKSVLLSARLRVAFVTLEMPKVKVVQNLLAAVSGVPSRLMREGRYGPEEERRVIEAAEQLAEGNRLNVIDQANMTVAQIRARARRLKMDGGLDLLVVDYLQLLKADDSSRYDKPRHEVVSELSRSLKALSAELEVPVLALSQLNRNVESRANPKPTMADLRESGSLEQDATVVLLVHRESYYEKDPDKRRLIQNEATLIVAKNRYGEGDNLELPLFFDPTVSLFADVRVSHTRAPHYPRPQARDHAMAAAGADA